MPPLILCEDALGYLASCAQVDALITSLPDAHDMGWSIVEWGPWFRRAIALCFAATKPSGVTIFYQTDRKVASRWLSKPSIISEVAASRRMLWHKIVPRMQPGKIDFYRPSYSHALAYSEHGKIGKPFADVLLGDAWAYPNAMPTGPTQQIVSYARSFGDTLLDPFCGSGTVLKAAEAAGFASIIGLDIDPAMVGRAVELMTL